VKNEVDSSMPPNPAQILVRTQAGVLKSVIMQKSLTFLEIFDILFSKSARMGL
jgi:hypothetical protein